MLSGTGIILKIFSKGRLTMVFLRGKIFVAILSLFLTSLISGLCANEIIINLSSNKTIYRLNDAMELEIEIKNTSQKAFYFFVPTVYKASYLLIKDRNGYVMPDKRTILLKKYPFSKEDFKLLKPGEGTSFKLNGKILLKENIEERYSDFYKKIVLEFIDCMFGLNGYGKYFICFQLTPENYPAGYFAKELGIKNVWGGEAKSNEIAIGVRR